MNNPNNIRERCEFCRFWDKFSLRCKRHAPIQITNSGAKQDQWPITFADDWCGDFERSLNP